MVHKHLYYCHKTEVSSQDEVIREYTYQLEGIKETEGWLQEELC
jgi:hypothetical protein